MVTSLVGTKWLFHDDSGVSECVQTLTVVWCLLHHQ